jgi:bisphosphoglycerate-dependent phosphoglycerate mutase
MPKQKILFWVEWMTKNSHEKGSSKARDEASALKEYEQATDWGYAARLQRGTYTTMPGTTLFYLLETETVITNPRWEVVMKIKQRERLKKEIAELESKVEKKKAELTALRQGGNQNDRRY